MACPAFHLRAILKSVSNHATFRALPCLVDSLAFRDLPVSMTYIVTDNCIRCKYMDCVEVCPVDCFYEGENMLVIHPDECIDCGVCEPECPAEAIKPDTEPGLDKWLEINSKYASAWPNITEKRDAPADAKEMDGVEGKYEKFFSEAPGQGD